MVVVKGSNGFPNVMGINCLARSPIPYNSNAPVVTNKLAPEVVKGHDQRCNHNGSRCCTEAGKAANWLSKPMKSTICVGMVSFNAKQHVYV